MPRSYVNAYVEGGSIVLLSRDGAGRRVEERVPARWSAFFRRGDLKPDLERLVAHVAKSVEREGDWDRYDFADSDLRRRVCFEERNRQNGAENPLVASGAKPREADVEPIRRFFTDTGATIQRPRRCYLDIETDSRLPFGRKDEMRILCWSVCDDEGMTMTGVLPEWSNVAERDLLLELYGALDPYDQVCAWYGGSSFGKDGFDFPVIRARVAEHDIPLKYIDHRRFLWLDHLAAFKRMNQHAAESGEEKRSMALQSIAQELLGEGKHDFDARQTYEAWAAGGERRREMVRYCMQDTRLLPKIEKKKGYLDLFTTLCEVCRLFAETGSLFPTRQMDGYMLPLARQRGQHLPSRPYYSHDNNDDAAPEEAQFKGAFVVPVKSLDPAWRQRQGMRTGILRNVHVGDFKSMYPSIILTWNMSPDTRVEMAPINGPIAEGLCRCPTTGTSFYTDKQGILTAFIDEMLSLRKQYQEQKASHPPGTPAWYEADGKSNAFKVAANSGFGATGNKYSRFYDRAVAEGITQNGVWLAQQTIAAAEARGWIVVYGDTDSIYVVGPTADEFRAFCKWCNAELYPTLVAKLGCKKSFIGLDYEKQFDWVCFTAKKRYVGKYLHFKGKAATADSKPEIKGLEYKRGDVSRFAAGLIEGVIDLMMAGHLDDPEPFHDLLSRARVRALEGELELEEIVVAKGLQKSIGRYDKDRKVWVPSAEGYAQKKKMDGTDAAQSPHVLVAKVLALRGRDVSVGTKVEYVVVDETADDPAKRVIPAEDYRGECDRHYVWESLVYPPTHRLLDAAFPEQADQWKAWSRSRPPKPRKGRAVAPGQAGLFAENETRVSLRPALPPPVRPKGNAA